MMPVLELHDESRPLAHYQDVMLRRLDPEKNPGHLLRDSDLVPKRILGAWKAAQLPDVMNRPMPRNLQAGRQRDYDARRLELIAMGLDPDQYIAPPPQPGRLPGLDDLPEFLAQMEQDIEQARRQADEADEERKRLVARGEANAREAGLPAQHPSTHVDPDEQIRQLDRLDELPPVGGEASPAAQQERTESKERLSAQIREGYLHSAHLSGQAPPLPSFRAAKIRRRLQAAPPGERNFSGLNLIGADLSGMDLRGANFSAATLTDANLGDAQLDDCDFSRAVLVRANMTRTSFTRARFDTSNLAQAVLQDTVLSKAQLRDVNCQGIHFTGCKLDGVLFERTDFLHCAFTRCDMRGSQWQQMTLLRLTLEDIALDGATISQTVWMECRLQRVSFADAKLTRCACVSTDGSQGVSYAGAMLEACAFAQATTLASVSFRGAFLKQCSLRGTDLTNADLGGVRLDGSDLSECILRGAQLDRAIGGESLFIRADLTGASLRNANLIDANLSKAILSLADLSDANLFRADVSQALIDSTTRLDGAYTRGAKVWPARRAPRTT
ncbi:Pentapeptide repeats (8 copies) [compost metagenome]